MCHGPSCLSQLHWHHSPFSSLSFTASQRHPLCELSSPFLSALASQRPTLCEPPSLSIHPFSQRRPSARFLYPIFSSPRLFTLASQRLPSANLWLHRGPPSANSPLLFSLLWLHRDYPLRTFGFTETHPLRTLLSFSLRIGFTLTYPLRTSFSFHPSFLTDRPLCENSIPNLFLTASFHFGFTKIYPLLLLFPSLWIHRDLPSANLLLFPSSILSHRDTARREFYSKSPWQTADPSPSPSVRKKGLAGCPRASPPRCGEPRVGANPEPLHIFPLLYISHWWAVPPPVPTASWCFPVPHMCSRCCPRHLWHMWALPQWKRYLAFMLFQFKHISWPFSVVVCSPAVSQPFPLPELEAWCRTWSWAPCRFLERDLLSCLSARLLGGGTSFLSRSLFMSFTACSKASPNFIPLFNLVTRIYLISWSCCIMLLTAPGPPLLESSAFFLNASQ